jgi:RNA polymerase sigma factor (sigma-70 family)
VRRSVYTGSRSLSGRGARVGLLEPLADEAFMPGRMDQAELFSAVYRKLSRSVFGYLRARGVEDPEAVTQDVFLALYTRMGTLHGGIEGVKTLVFSIAHARAVDHHRRRERVPASTPYDPGSDQRTVASPEEVAFAGTGVPELLETLPDDYREVLILRVVADLSIEQTAAIMGRSAGAVKQLQRRALAGLKEHVQMKAQGTL